ncbi:MAG: T9SS type A sorting domain-containing protein, partial [Bacteroidales bacterium]|nr:T9SS type A sorting domain-containing protein [Bacteroidales bacterium]
VHSVWIGSGSYDLFLDMWIDFNNDFLFTPDELVLDDVFIYSGWFDCVPIYIPISSDNGWRTTRIRTNRDAPVTDPCETYTYGHCFDFYTSIIGGIGSNYPPPVNLQTSLAANDAVQLTWSDPALSANRDLTGYEVFRDNNLLISLPLVNDFLDAGLDQGNYGYKMRAVYGNIPSEFTDEVQIYVPGISLPQIGFDPEVVITYHTAPMITTEVLMVTNTGDEILNFNISTILQTKSENDPPDNTTGSGIPMENLYTTGCTFGDGIVNWSLSNVNIQDIPCTGEPPWYHYFDDEAHWMETGNLQKLFITAGYDSTYVTVWIDYDDNFDLTPDEILLDNAVCPNAGSMHVFFVTVPPTANVGNFVLRARTNRQSPVNGPYETCEYGNCVDFDIHIDNGLPIDWLSVSPRNGTLDPGESMPVFVTFDSNFPPSPSGYSAFLKFVSNAPESPHLVPAMIFPTPVLPPVNDFSCFFSNPSTVELSWMPPVMETLRWDSGENCDGIGGTTHFSVAARWSPDFLTAFNGWLLTHLLFYPTSAEAIYVLKVWTGEQAENLLYSQPVDDYIPDQWNTVMLEPPVSITSGEWYWIGYEVTDLAWNYPAGADCGPAISGYGDMIQFDGQTWHSLSTTFGYDNNWNIAGVLAPGSTSKARDFIPNNYNVYRNAEWIATLPPTTFEYTDSLVPPDIPDYIVGAVYDEGEALSDACSPAPISWIQVEPESFNVELIIGETLTDQFLIQNTGHPDALMDFELEISYIFPEMEPSTGQRQEWLAVAPTSGQVAGQSSETIELTINTANLVEGFHYATVDVASNAQNTQYFIVHVFLDVITSVGETGKMGIQIYPNPAEGIFTVSGNQMEAKVGITNAFGVEIYCKVLTLPSVIDLSARPKGIYVIKVESDDETWLRKLVIN